MNKESNTRDLVINNTIIIMKGGVDLIVRMILKNGKLRKKD